MNEDTIYPALINFVANYPSSEKERLSINKRETDFNKRYLIEHKTEETLFRFVFCINKSVGPLCMAYSFYINDSPTRNQGLDIDLSKANQTYHKKVFMPADPNRKTRTMFLKYRPLTRSRNFEYFSFWQERRDNANTVITYNDNDRHIDMTSAIEFSCSSYIVYADFIYQFFTYCERIGLLKLFGYKFEDSSGIHLIRYELVSLNKKDRPHSYNRKIESLIYENLKLI